MPDTTELSIADLRTDGGTQPRAYLDGPTVMEYAKTMERGVELPPVSVMYDGKHYWLYDGFHRVKAAQNVDHATIRAEVEQGTQEDAQWASLAANKRHGLRRSQADKRRVIKRALKGWGSNKSDRAIARHVGCSNRTVGKYRAALEASGQITQIEEREVTRNGTTYTQRTTNIGTSRKRKQPKSSTSSGTAQIASDPKPMTTGSPSRRRRRDRRREGVGSAFDASKQQRETPPTDPVPTSEDVAQRIREELVRLPDSQAVSMLRDFVDEQHQFSAKERESVREAAERIGGLILAASEKIDGAD